MKRGLTLRMIVASSLLVFIVSGAFVVVIIAMTNLRESTQLRRQARAELLAADQLEKLVIDLETGMRGFVITSEAAFLEPWNGARAAFPEQAAALEDLAANDPVQLDRVRRIVQAVTAYIREYSEPLVEAVRRGDPSAGSLAEAAEGKQRIDALRAEFDSFATTGEALLAAREASADAAGHRAIIAGAAGLAGSIVLMLLFSGYLTRAIVRPVRAAAAMAGRLAGGDLGARMPETGAGEIGELERSFNSMASSLEASRAELIASRTRIVAAADAARRRIERNLHDGAQQRLVTLALTLRSLQASVPSDLSTLHAGLSEIVSGLEDVLHDLREISRGIHPAILSEGGLTPALKTLARRSAVPVELDVHVVSRLPEPVEVAAYYVVSEALANAAKHAHASVVEVQAGLEDGALRLSVRDDGAGGATPARGSGLVGLIDRVEALGGTLEVVSPAGAGTSLAVTLPIDADISLGARLTAPPPLTGEPDSGQQEAPDFR